MTKENLEKANELATEINRFRNHLLSFDAENYVSNLVCLYTEFIDTTVYKTQVQEKINYLKREFENL